MGKLELVQAHSLFTFMGIMTDGPGSFLRVKLPCHEEEVCICGSCDKLWSSAICAHTDVYTCAHIHTLHSVKLQKKMFVFPPKRKRCSIIISGGGASQELQGTS